MPPDSIGRAFEGIDVNHPAAMASVRVRGLSMRIRQFDWLGPENVSRGPAPPYVLARRLRDGRE